MKKSEQSKGLRNKLAARVLEDMYAIYMEAAKFAADPTKLRKGQEALLSLYRREPRQFIREFLSIIPKELNLETSLSAASEEELAALLIDLRERRARLLAEPETPTEDAKLVH
jgi:hypothetical protein